MNRRINLRGYFITFEGPDGSGKTTQLKLLRDYLFREGFDVLVTREPGGTPVGEAIREIILAPEFKEMDPKTEMLLYAASRAQHVSQVIKPALEEGKVVLCDRFLDSSIAYQGIGRGLGVDLVEEVNRIALQGILPDLTFFLDIDPDEGLKRSRNRGTGSDRLEDEALDFHKRVYEGFSNLCKTRADRFIRIPATGSIGEVHKRLIDEIGQLPRNGK